MTKPNYVKRGLSDLLQENTIADLEKEEVIEIPLDRVQPNPYQPRKHFDETALGELAEVDPHQRHPSAGDRQEDRPGLHARHRRTPLPRRQDGRVRHRSGDRARLQQPVSRGARAPPRTSSARTSRSSRRPKRTRNAIDSLQLTHLELAQKIGKSRSYVSNTLGILSLPESIVAEINAGNISMGHARALSKLKDAERIRTIARMIVENRLTVRDIEALVKSEKKKKEIKRREVPPTLAAGLARLKTSLGLRFAFSKPVRVSGNKIVIAFESDAEAACFAAFVDGGKDA
ncbi:MAG: hypothetical protein MZU97_14595 [Bacillus subtilis]|nr:hypothetical protein [Bacillus subtilis]